MEPPYLVLDSIFKYPIGFAFRSTHFDFLKIPKADLFKNQKKHSQGTDHASCPEALNCMTLVTMDVPHLAHHSQ